MIFVTGGTGLVGSHILLRLTLENKEFKALKRYSSSLDVCKRVFRHYNLEQEFLKIKWVTGDINDIPLLEKEIKGCDFVLHAAAIVSFNPGHLDEMNKVNIEGTANVVNVALDSGVKKIGYISSIATLSRETELEIVSEEKYFKNTGKESNYAISKYYAEQEIWRAAAEGLDVVVVNPSVILGPGDWNKGSSKMFQRSYQGLSFYTEGSTGYVDVLDVAKSIVKLLFSDIANERFIVNSANLSYKEFFEKLATEFNKPKPRYKANNFIRSLAWRAEAIKCFITGGQPLITKETAYSASRKTSYSNKKIKSKLNFQFININATIKNYCKWFKDDLE